MINYTSNMKAAEAKLTRWVNSPAVRFAGLKEALKKGPMDVYVRARDYHAGPQEVTTTSVASVEEVFALLDSCSPGCGCCHAQAILPQIGARVSRGWWYTEDTPEARIDDSFHIWKLSPIV